MAWGFDLMPCTDKVGLSIGARLFLAERSKAMKLADMNPVAGVPHTGRDRWVTVGAWAFCDYMFVTDGGESFPVRNIYHYGVLMGQFASPAVGSTVWSFEPLSIGIGSVSDQQGCNKVVQGMDGWYFQRAGGAQWVQR